MSGSQGGSGFGVTILKSATLGGGGSYTLIGQITDIKTGVDATSIDISHSTSPSTFREKIAGMGDAGELDVTALYNRADTAIVYALHRVQLSYKIIFPDGSSWVCDGFLKKLGIQIPMDDAIEQDWTIELSGKPVFTAAS